jgi:tetratricopeptide (TPR) repeat protein
MKKLLLPGLLVLVAALLGCASVKQYDTYRKDMWNGKKLLGEGEYKPALEDFLSAAKAMPNEPESYAFAATASFKMNDVDAASGYIREAVKLNKPNDAYIRILGYKALILLKQAKQKDGMEALSDYIQAYQKEYAPQNVREVRTMWRTKNVDLSALQQLLDEEIWVYESDMEQFRKSGTGWFAAKYGTTVPNR